MQKNSGNSRSVSSINKIIANSLKEKPKAATPKGRTFSDLKFQDPISPLRIACFDLESSSLNGSFGVILCGVIQFYSPNELKVFRADSYPSWKRGIRSDDSGIVKDILAELEKADIILGHNAVNFDMPFLRTRALIHNLPPVNHKKILDPVLLARKLFRFHSNSLDSIAGMLTTNFKKTPLDPHIWQTALADGNTDSMNCILEHCIKDVFVLEEVAKKIAPYSRQIDNIGSFR